MGAERADFGSSTASRSEDRLWRQNLESNLLLILTVLVSSFAKWVLIIPTSWSLGKEIEIVYE